MTVADLIDAGLLAEGDQLVFDRPRIGQTHSARVTRGGWLELLDGRQFRSPSRAASAAVGEGSFDGWHAWALPDGPLLDQLRQQLLDSVAADMVVSGAEATAPAGRHVRLKQARELAEEGKPMTLSVRELLGWWGAQRRGYHIAQQVTADLANHSLTTSPDFEAVYLDATVQLVSVASDTDIQDGPGQALQVSEAQAGDDEAEEPVAGLTVGNLPSAFGGVIHVTPSATFEEAITQMAINEFSQLPVLSGQRKLEGAVTWKSIARSRHANPDAPLSKAIIRAHDVPYDRDLIDILPLLAEAEFVLVRDQANIISGIVTASDVAVAYGAMATPFFLVGEFDRLLRRVIANCFAPDDVKLLCDPEGARGISSFDDMSIGDYQRVLQNKDAWERLGWPLDRKVFTRRLGEIREIRNDLMHFNPDPLPEDAVQKIRHMINLLREYGA